MENSRIVGFPSNYKTPSAVGSRFELLNLIPPLETGVSNSASYINGSFGEISALSFYGVKIQNQSGDLLFAMNNNGEIVGNAYFTIQEGVNIITYDYKYKTISGQDTDIIHYTETFTIFGVTNRLPLKPWTNEEVINRVLQLAEPLRAGGTPRFSLDIANGEVSERQFQALAPEFTFTRMNMREVMQTVGGVLHGEPRLHLNDDYTGRWTYDKYGGNTLATYKNFATGAINPLNAWRYTTNRRNQDIEQACTKLDSYQDNLVNRIAWRNATIGKPSENLSHGITLRADNLYLRLGEDDGAAYIPTDLPIDKIVSLECVYRENGETVSKDITAYVVPQSVYDNLSSYGSSYPDSKSYALYYTLGERNLKGFFFKETSAFGSTDKDYSIVNILKRVSVPKSVYDDYFTIEFRLTYVPIYSTRIQHSKSYLSDHLAAPRVINYSQGDNSVETRFFGENIKGVAQRLGTVEKYVSFNFKYAENIPKQGDKWDDDYYISTVNVSVFRDRFEITCGLSKNFNRKSKYIGANAHKRIYEVSETMVQERHKVLTDNIIFATTESGMTASEYSASDFGDLYLSANGFNRYMYTLEPVYYSAEKTKAQSARIKGYNYKKEPLTGYYVDLPCVCAAFGNSIEFTFECLDNFSAGTQVEKETAGDITGYFTKGTPYSDYYGRMYYMEWQLTPDRIDPDDLAAAALSYPADSRSKTNAGVELASTGGLGTGTVEKLDLYRKDSREKTKISYRVESFAEDESFIIGSGFGWYNILVTNERTSVEPHLFILKNPIGKFDDLFDDENAVDLGEITITSSSFSGTYVKINGKRANASGQAWVIAYPYYNGDTFMVEDEEGNVAPYTPRYGGEILIGRNVPISAGDTVGDFVAYAVHDLQAYINARRKAGKLEI